MTPPTPTTRRQAFTTARLALFCASLATSTRAAQSSAAPSPHHLDVRAFRAKGDSTTDDTAAFRPRLFPRGQPAGGGLPFLSWDPGRRPGETEFVAPVTLAVRVGDKDMSLTGTGKLRGKSGTVFQLAGPKVQADGTLTIGQQRYRRCCCRKALSCPKRPPLWSNNLRGKPLLSTLPENHHGGASPFTEFTFLACVGDRPRGRSVFGRNRLCSVSRSPRKMWHGTVLFE